MSEFKFKPASWVPFKDQEVMDRVRKISGTDLEKHPNKDFKIKVLLNPHPIMVADMFARIRDSDIHDKKVVMILPAPEPDTYGPVAELVNMYRVNCRNVYIFMQDEWADQDGNIAPITYRAGFGYSLMTYFYKAIDLDLRMPIENIVVPNNKNIDSYSDMIVERGGGGADVIYTSPGWTGHIAFVDPMDDWNATDRIITDLKDPYFSQKAKLTDIHVLTIAQNSLHGVFGQSGDVANVPPRAATIGPYDLLHARNRIEIHALQTNGTFASWQRMVSRLVLHGPATPMVPSSVLQLMPTFVYVSEALAAPFECFETMGY